TFHAWTEAIFPYVKNGTSNGDFNVNVAKNNQAAIYVDPAWNYTAPAKDSAGTSAPAPDVLPAYPFGSYLPNIDLMPQGLFHGCSWAPYSAVP
ncbi:hypothetical protein ABTL31_18620, partial [Acinetobacter baumannii]